MAYSDKDGIVVEMAALKGLAHPLRVQLLDALSAYGPSTSCGLAERLGESSGSTSYHLRQLAKHGFVREDITRGSSRERWWERVPRPIMLDATGFAPDSADMAASGLIVAELQRTRQARLNAYIMGGIGALGQEWMEASGTLTANLQLTREQTHQLTEALSDVLDGFVEKYRSQQVPGARPVQVHLDVFPLIDGVEQPGDVGGTAKDEQ